MGESQSEPGAGRAERAGFSGRRSLPAERGEDDSGFTAQPSKMRPARKWIALGVLAALAGLDWGTIGAGRLRLVVLLLLAMFAVRIVLTASRS